MRMFSWGAVEEQFGPALGGLGVYKGPPDATWGVSTLTIVPVTGEPYVTLFRKKAEAIAHARNAAFKAGSPQRRERGKTYYVVYSPLGPEGIREELLPRFKVLRSVRPAQRSVPRGEWKKGGYPAPPEVIYVFENAGLQSENEPPTDPKNIRWKLNKGLSVTVRDLELERELEKERRRDEQISSRDRTFGIEDKLRRRLAELQRQKEHIEQLAMNKQATKRHLRRRTEIIEMMNAINDRLLEME